jgi:hypothetical protein
MYFADASASRRRLGSFEWLDVVVYVSASTAPKYSINLNEVQHFLREMTTQKKIDHHDHGFALKLADFLSSAGTGRALHGSGTEGAVTNPSGPPKDSPTGVRKSE